MSKKEVNIAERRKIRFGIIGGGLMGREFAQAVARWDVLSDFSVRPEIVGVCDVNPKVLGWYAEHYPELHVATADHRELLEQDEVEAVYCAVPHNLHAELYIDVIESGKHLLGEKPFGIDLEANARIMASIREHPDVLVRVSSEFPFYPGAQRIVRAFNEGNFGQILEVRSGFRHSYDLDPNKPINWSRTVEANGEYGCMGDLGMHAVHLPFRFGWVPRNVRALLTNVFAERPGKDGTMVPCETWDNAVLATEVEVTSRERFPMIVETKRIAPGERNTWYLEVLGTRGSMAFSTKHPRTLWLMEYEPGEEQAWRTVDLGYEGAYRAITNSKFEFGFTDAFLQMCAAFVDELDSESNEMLQPFTCATPEEAELSHYLFTAALESQIERAVVELDAPDNILSTPKNRKSESLS